MGQQGSKDRTVPMRTNFARDSAKMRLGSFKRGRRGWIWHNGDLSGVYHAR